MLFFSTRDGGWFPTLRLLHQYPHMMPRLRADKGAIRFVLSGANIMCPGLTSPGATMHDEVREATPVAIYGEGCDPAIAIGFTTMSTEQVRHWDWGPTGCHVFRWRVCVWGGLVGLGAVNAFLVVPDRCWFGTALGEALPVEPKP